MRAGFLRRVSIVVLGAMAAGMLAVVATTDVASAAVCPFGVEGPTECVVSSPVAPGPGPHVFSKTLHVTGTGHVDGSGTGITINVNGAPNLDLIMDAGAVIEADDDVPTPNDPAAPITINVSGNALLAAGSRISADNNDQGGTGGNITIDVDHDMTLAGTPGVGTCRTAAGLGQFDGLFGSGSVPNVYADPSLGARISALRLGASSSANGGDISITVGTDATTPPTGVFTVERCAIVDASSLGSGGAIVIDAGKVAQIDGLVLSEAGLTGTGAVQGTGGGPITIIAGCGLTVGDTGYVSSRGRDPGADLVHLESCEVRIFGVVQSTTSGDGHALPNSPTNHCNDDPVAHPPGGASGFTGCVEVWAKDITIDASGAHNGNVNVDGIRAPMRGWIDLFAVGNLSILGEPAGAPKWAVSADACPPPANSPCSNAFGGLITAKAVNGTVTTQNQAILQAHATAIGGDGGTIIVQAGGNVDLDGSFIDATGPTGDNTKGGSIAVKSFNGANTGSASGKLDATGDGVAFPGSVSLVQCAAGPSQYLGTVTPPTVPVFGQCGGNPSLPANATSALAADAQIWERCNQQPGPPRIRGVKFNDANGNHVQDGSEPLLAGWDITLWDATQTNVVATTQTDANGEFEFLVDVGSYVICETVKPGWAQTAPVLNPPANPACTSGGVGFAVTVVAGDDLFGFAFGNRGIGKVSGSKWKDVNANHVRDGEPLLPGWEIKLWNATVTSVVATTQTDANGAYSFTNVPAGSYVICESVQAGWTQTTPVAGPGIVPCPTGLGYAITLDPGGDITGRDFGNQTIPPGKIRGKKFNDANGNHYKDSGESGLAGWTIKLYNADLSQNLATTTTDANGLYAFDNLQPGNYVVCEVFQNGWTQTAPVAGAGIVPCPNGLGHAVSLGAGQDVSGKDFGNKCTPLMKISGKKFKDVNGNGVRDYGDDGLSGWTVKLWNANQTQLLGTDVTDVNGYYSFSGLQPGTYVVCEIFQAGWTQTAPVAGAGKVNCTSGGIGYSITLTTQDVGGKDFGNKCTPLMKIKGKKFNDANGNGVKGYGEDYLSGWTIKLWNANQTVLLATDVTDSYGAYMFTNLQPGTYVVCEIIQSGWMQTAPTAGAGKVTCNSGGIGYSITLTTSDVSGKDFGNKCTPPSKISGKKFNDADGDHYRDSGEGGLTGWTIKLWNETQTVLIATDVTDYDGYYSFWNVAPGKYVVCEVPQSGWIQTAPVAGTGKVNCAGSTIGYAVTVVAGQSYSGRDFGNKCNPPAKIKGLKWKDSDGDRYKDYGEDVLSGWTINLYNSNQSTLLATDATDSYGYYSFTVPAGTYVVCETLKSGWVQTAPVAGSGKVSCNGGGIGYLITVSAGQTASGKDFGNKYTYTRY
jgi:protocatechuate 3,4-dioxygenase beta subunit